MSHAHKTWRLSLYITPGLAERIQPLRYNWATISSRVRVGRRSASELRQACISVVGALCVEHVDREAVDHDIAGAEAERFPMTDRVTKSMSRSPMFWRLQLGCEEQRTEFLTAEVVEEDAEVELELRRQQVHRLVLRVGLPAKDTAAAGVGCQSDVLASAIEFPAAQ